MSISDSVRRIQQISANCAVVALLFAADANAQRAPSGWIGVYEPFSPRACTEPMIVYESKFSWGRDCRSVKIRIVAASETQLAFEVDPKSKCGWPD
jgi:hypothetical protein